MEILITTKNAITSEYKEMTMSTGIDMSFTDVDKLHSLFKSYYPNCHVNFIWRSSGSERNSFIFGVPEFMEKDFMLHD